MILPLGCFVLDSILVQFPLSPTPSLVQASPIPTSILLLSLWPQRVVPLFPCRPPTCSVSIFRYILFFSTSEICFFPFTIPMQVFCKHNFSCCLQTCVYSVSLFPVLFWFHSPKLSTVQENILIRSCEGNKPHPVQHGFTWVHLCYQPVSHLLPFLAKQT